MINKNMFKKILHFYSLYFKVLNNKNQTIDLNTINSIYSQQYRINFDEYIAIVQFLKKYTGEKCLTNLVHENGTAGNPGVPGIYCILQNCVINCTNDVQCTLYNHVQTITQYATLFFYHYLQSKIRGHQILGKLLHFVYPLNFVLVTYW